MSQFEQRNSPNQPQRDTRELKTPAQVAERQREVLRTKLNQSENNNEVQEAENPREAREATVRQVAQELVGVGVGFREVAFRNPARPNAVAPHIDPTTQLPRQTDQERDTLRVRAKDERAVDRTNGLTGKNQEREKTNSTEGRVQQDLKTKGEDRESQQEKVTVRDSQLSQLQMRGGARPDPVNQPVLPSPELTSLASRETPKRPGEVLNSAQNVPPTAATTASIQAGLTPPVVAPGLTQGVRVLNPAGVRPLPGEVLNERIIREELLQPTIRPVSQIVERVQNPNAPLTPLTPQDTKPQQQQQRQEQITNARTNEISASAVTGANVVAAAAPIAAAASAAVKLAPLPETQLLEMSQLEIEARLRHLRHNDQYWNDLAARETIRLDTDRRRRLLAQEVAEREFVHEEEKKKEESRERERFYKKPQSFRSQITSRFGNRGKPLRDDETKQLTLREMRREAEKERRRNLNQVFVALFTAVVAFLYFTHS